MIGKEYARSSLPPERIGHRLKADPGSDAWKCLPRAAADKTARCIALEYRRT